MNTNHKNQIETTSLLSLSSQSSINYDNICIVCIQGTIINIDDATTDANTNTNINIHTNNDANTNTEFVNSIIEIPFLIKECNCIFNVHYTCLEKWLKSNSVCPICRQPIMNENQLIPSTPPPPYHIIHIPETSQFIIRHNEANTANTAHMFIKFIFYLLLGCVFISLIRYYLL